MCFWLYSCSFFDQSSQSSSTVSTPAEEYIDTTLARNILLQSIYQTDKETNMHLLLTTMIQGNIETKQGDYYLLKDYTAIGSLNYTKTGSADQTIINYELRGPLYNDDQTQIWYYTNDVSIMAQAIVDPDEIMDSNEEYLDSNGEYAYKYYSVIDKKTWEEALKYQTPINILSSAGGFDLMDPIKEESNIFTGKKITKGTKIQFKFNLIYFPNNYYSNDIERMEAVFTVENDLIRSIEVHCTMSEGKIDQLCQFTYGIKNKIDLPNLKEFTYID